ncbi:beta-lactamase family protein [Allokutzneria sp. A3M-2-11 16]|uniref:serine hydrolase domain-containing protein n=1 Tax=Allokutzneria sp. A3M-2-11 16 TaxID=2962043 RepID=UPI0020B698D0|nr:serine hydrolase domain-containing protein [Allokutzneria sp. A3M-2-11 16]MCP3804314.1 beta-lactamase family protein [Allokutzneria sp. A3M-2-11 16]
MKRIRAWLADEVPRLIDKHGVPGAAVAVLADGEIVDVAAGVLNRGTGVAATTDSLFQIGSITKLWTAALVMQLVDERVISLGDPVTEHLPDLRLPDDRVTVRQLLNHTSGLDGDVVTPTTRGDDAISAYVETVVPRLAQTMPPGTGFSYCNSGYVILGRLVEVLRGKPFHAVVRERIADRLKLTHVATIPEEALLYRTALGHIEGVGPAPVWSLPASIAPAGSLLSMTARSLVGFAAAHLEGSELLSEAALTTLWESDVDVPDIGSFARHWGPGWASFDWDGARVLGHDGGTMGQAAFLRVVPQAGVAVAVLTNGGTVGPFADEVLGHVLGELAPVRLPAPERPPAAPGPVDAGIVTGTYSSAAYRLEISVDGSGRASARMSAEAPELRATMPEPIVRELVRLDEHRLITLEPGPLGRHDVYVFVSEGGPAGFVFVSGRLLPRIG